MSKHTITRTINGTVRTITMSEHGYVRVDGMQTTGMSLTRGSGATTLLRSDMSADDFAAWVDAQIKAQIDDEARCLAECV